MGIKKQATQAVKKLQGLHDAGWTEKDKKEAAKIIEAAILNTVHEFCDTSARTINECCSADQDKAHKLNQELKQIREAIITNLSSLR
jgi:hypothetical protein